MNQTNEQNNPQKVNPSNDLKTRRMVSNQAQGDIYGFKFVYEPENKLKEVLQELGIEVLK